MFYFTIRDKNIISFYRNRLKIKGLNMGSLGELLRSAREKKNISLDDIANATKISKNILIALEDEKYELLPSKVFVKGFLRSYGRYVGLEINELWNLYERACGEKKSDKPSEPPETKKKRFRASYLIFLFLLLGLFGLLVYHFCCLKGNFESSLIPQ
ncbi:MAG: helix-turn-helix domain-containing protein, partial [Desulfobacterota bacterium]|nr:helix-turn-helix domain-containing protein [Thermodesulfobacteriota bacterium]